MAKNRKKIIEEAQYSFTFDDVLLKPAMSNILPSDANTKTKITKNIELNIPIISAAMDTITESRLAIAMAQSGGIGCIHKNLSIKDQSDEVRKVKKFESGVVLNPVTITPDETLGDALNLMTEKDLEKTKQFPNACKDKEGRLRVSAATSVGKDGIKRAESLIEAGVDVLIIDTAHGHSAGVIETVRQIKKLYPKQKT